MSQVKELFFLSQVKELGLLVQSCPCLTADLQKIFDMYWYLSRPTGASVPNKWPKKYSTDFNSHHPLQVPINGTDVLVYISVCYDMTMFCCFASIQRSHRIHVGRLCAFHFCADLHIFIFFTYNCKALLDLIYMWCYKWMTANIYCNIYIVCI